MRMVLQASLYISHFLQYLWFWLSSGSIRQNLLKQQSNLMVRRLCSLVRFISCIVYLSWIRSQIVNFSMLIRSMLYLTCNLIVSLSSSVTTSLERMYFRLTFDGGINSNTVSVCWKNYFFLKVLQYLRYTANGCFINAILLNYMSNKSYSDGMLISSELLSLEEFCWFFDANLASSLKSWSYSTEL